MAKRLRRGAKSPGRTGQHGGRRKGAGGKPSPVTALRIEIAAQVQHATGARMAHLLETLLALANGGYERDEETWKRAGSLFVEVTARDDQGQVLLDGEGWPLMVRVRMFPDRPDDELVLVRRVRSIAEPDRVANQYLIDRCLGKPAQAVRLAKAVSEDMVGFVRFPDEAQEEA